MFEIDLSGLSNLSTSAVSAPRMEYLAAVSRWRRCRDVIAGGDAVKTAGELYLPSLSGQRTTLMAGSGMLTAYDAYKLRALFYGATARTVAGLAGAVVRKPATVAVPDGFIPRLEDVTASGLDLDQLATAVLEEVLSVGRVGLLVDYDGESVPEGARRPYLVRYDTEQILNWQMTKRQLTMLVLREQVERRREGNPFMVDLETQYRVFQLVDGVCTVTTAREDARTHRLETDPPVVLLRRGQPVPFIPFTACGPSTLGLEICKPPLLDVVDINLSHYRTSADLEHGRHFTSLVTPWVSGMKPSAPGAQMKPMTIGPGEAWVLEDPQARAGMLEFSGAGLASLVIALETKEKMMSILGARLLEGQPQQQETATAVRLRHSGDDSTLRSMATAVSQLLTVSLRTMAWWDDATPLLDDPAITCDLNQDFLDTSLGADQVKTMLLAVQAGAMSFDTFYHLMARGEWTIPGRTVDDERHAIHTDEALTSPQGPQGA